MKRFLFAAALVALGASVGAADEKSAPPATSSAPVVISTAGSPIVESSPAQSTRRGLLGRLRNRGNNTSTMTYSPATPVMSAPTGATPMPPVSAPQPMPMPGTKTTTAPAPGTIVQASGSLPAGTYTTTDGTIIQIGGTQPTAQPMTDSQSSRRGLFSRLRNR